MQPRIETLKEKKLVGLSLKMSLADNKTAELWQSFMPRRKEINNPQATEIFSLQVYEPSYFDSFDPYKVFEKFALVEVTDFEVIPHKMKKFTLPGGLYAVFDYKGLSTDTKIFEYIFSTWLPGSTYSLDNRPHFEILGEKYANNDPNSEEAIWIPIKYKEIVGA
ncbi:MAG: GyrI-like domain-containing protein [Bacteroidota bacterium]